MQIVLSILLYLLAHEGGHFLCALAFRLRPRLEYGKWYLSVEYILPTPDQYRIVSVAGFGAGMLVGLALIALLGTAGAWVDKGFLLCYWGVLAAHFVSYPWRMKESGHNDFNGLCSHMKG